MQALAPQRSQRAAAYGLVIKWSHKWLLTDAFRCSADGGLQNNDPKVIAKDFLTSTVHLEDAWSHCTLIDMLTDIVCQLYYQHFDFFFPQHFGFLPRGTRWKKKSSSSHFLLKRGSNICAEAHETRKDSTAAFQDSLLKADYYTH